MAAGRKNELSDIASRERRAEDLGLSHGFIEAEHEGERTLDVGQDEILENVDLGTSGKKWRKLYNRGPYRVDYTDDGSCMLVAGERGDARLLDCRDATPDTSRELCVVNTSETIRASKMCYNENCWALAQKNAVCLYDRTGTRIHDFDNSSSVTALDYLPYHFLLVTGLGLNGKGGLEWRDLSTGKFVAQLKTKLLSPSPEALRKNLYNGCIYSGHSDGLVKIWSPNLAEEAMTFHGLGGGVDTIAPLNRTYVAVTGPRQLLKIYDIRNPKESVSHYRLKSSGPVSLDVSYSGLLAISQGPQVNIWKQPTAPLSVVRKDAAGTDERFYMRHRYDGNGLRFQNVRFRPFEDVLAGGLNKGVETLLIPGSGSAAIDVLDNNPFATNREKAKALIRRLLDKLPPDTIMLDPSQLMTLRRRTKVSHKDTKKRHAPIAAK